MNHVLVDLNVPPKFPFIEEKNEIATEVKNIHQSLIDGCLKNDALAQKQIYDLYSVAIFSTCVRMVVNRVEAQDILQDAFIGAFKGIKNYNGKSTFGAWLKRIAIHKCIDHLNRKKRLRMESLSPRHDKDSDAETEDEFPEVGLEQIHAAILKLPDGCRNVFVLKAMEDYDHKEIAEEMKISVGTSKSQYNRARQLLQESLTKLLNDQL